MRREQGEELVVGELPFQRLETDLLQNDIAIGVTETSL
jgi:hypothetical protein